MLEARRLVPLTGSDNFRDLGGYRGTDGRPTRWGRLYRSDALHELTTSDVAALQSRRLSSVIDLRTAKEVARTGRGPLAECGLGYLHASVVTDGGGETRAAPTLRGGDVSARYLWYLDNTSTAFPRALALLADPAAYPVVFHCTAGKDRTGVLAALVLDLVGVAHPVIVEDYLQTAPAMTRIIERLRRDPVYGPRIDEAPPSAFTVVAASMAGFLKGLETRYGGARAWALGAGVSPQTLDALAENLLA